MSPAATDSAGGLPVSISRDSLIAEQLRLLLKSLLPICVGTATAVIVIFVLHSRISPVALYGWGAAMFLWQGLRLILWLRFRRFRCVDAAARRWALPVALMMTAGGLLWGLFASQFYAISDWETRVFMLFVVTGLVTGGAVSFIAFLPAYYGYLFGAVLPLVLAFLWHGSNASLLLGGMAAVYIAALAIMARAVHRNVAELIALQLEKGALIGDLRKSKDMAERASHVKSQFLANMSHELRTPLNAIIGFSDILRRQLFGPLGDTRYQDYAGDINRSGQHLLRIINDILDLSKLEAKAMELAEDLVDLGRLVTECARFVGTDAAKEGVEIAVDLSPALPPLRADELRVKQVVLNLLSNAVKFSPRGSRITIGARLAADGGMVLVVRDKGIGMSADEIAIALQPFRQVEGPASRRHAGTGLGLPLAKSLVERHDGTLKIDSERGLGTSVTVSFPRARVAPASPIRGPALAPAPAE
jgi:signal transduction histidine kinase